MNAGQSNKFGRAVVGVVDDLGSPVEGAVVSGEFTATFTDSVAASDPTDACRQVAVRGWYPPPLEMGEGCGSTRRS